MAFDSSSKLELVAATPEELGEFSAGLGMPSYRGKQLFNWIQGKHEVNPDNMGNLPAAMRNELSRGKLRWPAKIGKVLRSGDGTRKLEVLLEDGSVVETVLIPDGGKLTQCISCQVGCAIRCKFCRSGHMGLKRNMTPGEIIAQVHLGLAEHLPGEKLRNIVVMGVGEPMHNLDAVLRAVRILAHGDGMDFSTRRVTVSTVGLVKGIDRLAQLTGGEIALAVSLHAADDATRAALVPGAKDSLADIIAALRRYPLPKRRRFTIEYVMVDGVNDGDQHARRLVKLLSELKVKVNLLPLNSHDCTQLGPPSNDRVLAFQKILVDKGVSAFLRRRRGEDIGAACGQLLAQRQ